MQVAPEAPSRAGGDGEGTLEGYRPAALIAANLLVARSRSGDGLFRQLSQQQKFLHWLQVATHFFFFMGPSIARF